MKICIKNPAPDDATGRMWGDFEFGRALQQALIAEGVEATQHYWPNWYADQPEAEIAIALRGKRRFFPNPGQPAILWVISHPSTVSLEEMDDYAVVCTASSKHAAMIRDVIRTRVEVLEQCTDTGRFFPDDRAAGQEREGVFMVANSRGLLRPILDWALQAGAPPKIIGRGWSGVGVGGLVVQQHVDNAVLPNLYRRARLCLNDHWDDMRYFGIVNNRILDCIACGVPVVTDDFPEVRAVAGDAALYVSGAQDYQRALVEIEQQYPAYIDTTANRWQSLKSRYSFSTRAKELLSLAHDLISARSMTDQRLTGLHPAIQPSAQHHRQVLDALINLAKQDLETPNLRLLHIAPTPTIAGACLGYDGLSYQSAGLGQGPWEIKLDAYLTRLHHAQFHVLFIEQPGNLTQLPETQRFHFVSVLVDCLELGGYIGIGQTDSAHHWQPMLSWLGLKELTLPSGIKLYERSKPKLIQQLDKKNHQITQLKQKLRQQQEANASKINQLKQRLIQQQKKKDSQINKLKEKKDLQIQDLKTQLEDWKRYGAWRQIQGLGRRLTRKLRSSRQTTDDDGHA